MKTIAEFLLDNKLDGKVSFRMPGHKSNFEMFARAGYGDFFDEILKEDWTQISPDAINELQKSYANLYGVMESRLLYNGSDIGIIASILCNVKRGGKLLLSRSSNQAAFNAMRIGNIQPIYMRDSSEEEIKITCEDNPDASAILISNPDFQGNIPDVMKIADIAHTYGMLLIVDQSYGAHLKFFDAVRATHYAAEDLGADIIIDGLDATLLAFTGCSLLNICSNRVDVEHMDSVLESLQSSKPNSLLLGSMDINEKLMRRWGGDMVIAWRNDLRYVYSRFDAIDGVDVIYKDDFDTSKINISLAAVGVSGKQLKQEIESYGVLIQQVYGNYVQLMSGAGNCREDYMYLVKVVRDIINNYAVGAKEEKIDLPDTDFILGVTEIPVKRELIPLYRADGRVLYSPIITYPPGRAIACPGEIMNMELISYIAKALEYDDTIEGVDEEGQIYVGTNVVTGDGS